MGEYSSWGELTRAVQTACKDMLKNDVAPAVENILRRHIQADIYDAYTPKHNGWVTTKNGITYYDTYHRRGSLLKNITSFISGGAGSEFVLYVTSTAEPMPSIRGQAFYSKHPGFFLEMLESLGTEKARYRSLWAGEFPRPAVSNTQEEINSGKEIVNTIQSGIDRLFS